MTNRNQRQYDLFRKRRVPQPFATITAIINIILILATIGGIAFCVYYAQIVFKKEKPTKTVATDSKSPSRASEDNEETTEKNRTESNAKVIASALRTYASRNRQVWPSAEVSSAEVQRRISPLIPLDKYPAFELATNNGSSDAAFIYTFAGGRITPQKESSTLVAYLRGPAGRAAIYADGHVKWQDGRD